MLKFRFQINLMKLLAVMKITYMILKHMVEEPKHLVQQIITNVTELDLTHYHQMNSSVRQVLDHSTQVTIQEKLQQTL